MGTITVKNVINKNNIITVDYDVSDDIVQYFNMENKFKVEYFNSIENVKEDIAIIPFVTNVLPIIWITDSTLYIDNIDEIFMSSIQNVKNAFQDMYPNAQFKGKIKTKSTIKNTEIITAPRTSTLFSGGVDSTSTLIDINKTNPFLITVWGSDIWDYDELGWKEAKETVERFSKEFGIDNLYLKSNFRKFINEEVLTQEFCEVLKDSWWHGVQHGIGLLGHVAPYAYQYNITTHYIPATYTKEDANVTCASYPTIDESLKFANCNIIHEGFDKTRQQKVKNICEYAENTNKDIKLRVCYMERGTKLNCCHCEKCYRTILAILSEKCNPEKYGFPIDKNIFKTIKKEMKTRKLITRATEKMWKEIQNNFIQEREYWKKQKNIRWFLKYKIEIK